METKKETRARLAEGEDKRKPYNKTMSSIKEYVKTWIPSYFVKGYTVATQFIKSHFVKGYTVGARLVRGYTVKGRTVNGRTVKGYTVKGHTVKGHYKQTIKKTNPTFFVDNKKSTVQKDKGATYKVNKISDSKVLFERSYENSIFESVKKNGSFSMRKVKKK